MSGFLQVPMSFEYFKFSEFDCSCCGKGSGKQNMNHDFILFLDKIRKSCGFGLAITSGYRCKLKQQSLVLNPKYQATHPDKSSHCKGLAADIKITNDEKRAIFIGTAMDIASEMDLPIRIGISKRQGFCHIDIDNKPTPRLWIYS